MAKKRTKAANGEGSIYYESSRKRFVASFVDPQGKRIAKRFKTRQEASEWLTVARAEVYKDEYVPPSDITVGAWVLQYLEIYKKPNVKAKTYFDYLHSSEQLTPIADIPLQDLQPITIQTYYNELTTSQRTKVQVHRFLKGSLIKARELGIIKKSPMDAVIAPKSGKKKQVEVFTLDEIAKLLEATKNERHYKRYYPIFLVAVTTGMRIGEIMALKGKHLAGNKLSIKEEILEIKGKKIQDTTKTDHSVRTITLDETTASTIRDLAGAEDAYMFPTKNGSAIAPNQVRKAFRAMLVKTDIPTRNFHCLRHTNATQLLAAGIPIIEVSKRLGHAKVSYTLDLYGHAIPNKDKEIAEQIGSVFCAVATT